MRHVWDDIIDRPWFVLIISIVVGMVLFLGANLMIEKVERQRLKNQSDMVASDLRSLRSELEGLINRSIYLTYGIQAHIAVEGDIEPSTFSSLSEELVKHSSYLRNISLIKGHELVMVYPLLGNESALGLRFDRRQVTGFQKAIHYGGTVLLGPINLVQGGSGLIARTPVYVQGEQYWGQTAVVLDWDSIKQHIGLTDFTGKYQLSIENIDTDSKHSNQILGDGISRYSTRIQMERIHFPFSVWTLSAAPKVKYVLPWRGGWMILVSLLSMGCSFLFFHYLSQVGDLRERKNMALHLSNSKSRLLLSTVHDLRQPINALSITVKQLKNQYDPLQLEHAERCLQSINEFFEQLVSYEQLETGKQIAAKESFLLIVLLRELVEELLPVAQAKGLRLIMFSFKNVVVFSDRVLLRRVVRNLVMNAIDNTDTGTIKVSAIINNQYVDVSVVDTGRGIAHHEISSVTEPFYQVDVPLASGGMGLGLDIVTRLCVLLDVGFTLNSELAEGTRAGLRIPISTHQNKDESMAGTIMVRLLEEVSLPAVLREKFHSWGVNWSSDPGAAVNLLITESSIDELKSNRKLQDWQQPTLVLSNAINESQRLGEQVWVVPISHPVSIIRRTLIRIIDDVYEVELLE